MQVLVELGLLTQAELEAAIVSEFNPIRVGFKGGAEPLTIDNVLNIGVCPKTLIATMRAKFEVLGGVIYEVCGHSSVYGNCGCRFCWGGSAGMNAGVLVEQRACGAKCILPCLCWMLVELEYIAERQTPCI